MGIERGPDQNGNYTPFYCNKPHRMHDGVPVGHRCRILPPAYLEAEIRRDIGSIEMILFQHPIVLHQGVGEEIVEKNVVEVELAIFGR